MPFIDDGKDFQILPGIDGVIAELPYAKGFGWSVYALNVLKGGGVEDSPIKARKMAIEFGKNLVRSNNPFCVLLRS